VPIPTGRGSRRTLHTLFHSSSQPLPLRPVPFGDRWVLAVGEGVKRGCPVRMSGAPGRRGEGADVACGSAEAALSSVSVDSRGVHRVTWWVSWWWCDGTDFFALLHSVCNSVNVRMKWKASLDHMTVDWCPIVLSTSRLSSTNHL